MDKLITRKSSAPSKLTCNTHEVMMMTQHQHGMLSTTYLLPQVNGLTTIERDQMSDDYSDIIHDTISLQQIKLLHIYPVTKPLAENFSRIAM